jgi:GTPase SAR1 family protein
MIRIDSLIFSLLGRGYPVFKVLLVGDGSIGKTTLVKRLKNSDYFEEAHVGKLFDS